MVTASWDGSNTRESVGYSNWNINSHLISPQCIHQLPGISQKTPLLTFRTCCALSRPVNWLNWLSSKSRYSAQISGPWPHHSWIWVVSQKTMGFGVLIRHSLGSKYDFLCIASQLPMKNSIPGKFLWPQRPVNKSTLSDLQNWCFSRAAQLSKADPLLIQQLVIRLLKRLRRKRMKLSAGKHWKKQCTCVGFCKTTPKLQCRKEGKIVEGQYYVTSGDMPMYPCTCKYNQWYTWYIITCIWKYIIHMYYIHILQYKD